MSDTAIIVERLGKLYLVGHHAPERERYTALRDVIGRELRGMARRAADLVRGHQVIDADDVEEFWALQDVTFEVKRGEVIGVIGRNGAGKSTLLKVLSRVTEPTQGRAILRGRIASLLEVGTGFHPELTGRENIFLNGAVLGMRREEVRRKFDEIVAFAEIEKFLDTPVKRYSSGMYVRLAFAVAAHLEPDILIVDEVLTVGDMEFQKKCLGKIKDVAGGGRTVLFVSHNMAAVKSLTNKVFVMHEGKVAFAGSAECAIERYATFTQTALSQSTGSNWGCGNHTTIRSVRLVDSNGMSISRCTSGTPIRIEVELETDGSQGLSCEMLLADHTGSKIGLSSLAHFQNKMLPSEAGHYRLNVSLAPLHLATGLYTVDVATSIVNQAWDHYVKDAIALEVLFSNPGGLTWDFKQAYGYGPIALPLDQQVKIVRLA